MIPLLCIILEAKFGIIAREWFTEESKVVHLKYKWDADQGQVVPLVPEEDDDDDYGGESDDEYFTAMANLLNIDTRGEAKHGFLFNIDYVIDDVAPTKNQYGDDGTVRTFRDACTPLPGYDSEDASSAQQESEDDMSTTKAHRSPSPDSMIVQTDSVTQATSTMTDDPSADIAASLEQLMLKNPELAQHLYLKNSAQILSTSVAVSPNEGVDGS